MRSWSPDPDWLLDPEERVSKVMAEMVSCSKCEVVFRPSSEGETECVGCQHARRIKEREEADRQAAMRRVAEDLPGAMEGAGVPPRYQRFTRASWEDRGWVYPAGAVRQIAAWRSRDFSEWLVFIFGLYGRRKTGLATAMLSEWLLAGGQGAVWLDQNDWLRRVKAGFTGRASLPGRAGREEGWDGGKNSDADVFNFAAKAPLLVFDDLGAVRDQTGNEWWKTMVAELFRHRHAHELPTIVTSNVARVEDLASIDGSLVSRMDVPMKLHLAGQDYRKARA